MTLLEAARQALEALEQLQGGCTDSDDGTVEAITVWCPEVIDALRQAIAEAEQHAVNTSQERVDEMVKTEHDKQIELAQAYERGWNAALAQQEPVAWRTFDGEGGYDYRSYEMNETYDKEWAERNPNHKGWVEPLYTAPPKREWVGLTALEIYECWKTGDVVSAVEAKLKERNHG